MLIAFNFDLLGDELRDKGICSPQFLCVVFFLLYDVVSQWITYSCSLK